VGGGHNVASKQWQARRRIRGAEIKAHGDVQINLTGEFEGQVFWIPRVIVSGNL